MAMDLNQKFYGLDPKQLRTWTKMATELTQNGSGLEPKWRRTWARMAMDLNQNGPFADCPTQTTQTKVIIIHKISARCAPHHIPFLPRPPLAQQEMPSIFQPILSSSWPQVCAEFLRNMIRFGLVPRKSSKKQCLNKVMPLCPTSLTTSPKPKLS